MYVYGNFDSQLAVCVKTCIDDSVHAMKGRPKACLNYMFIWHSYFWEKL